MSSRSLSLLFASGCMGCIALSGLQLPELNRLRKEHRLTEGDPLENAPPELAVLTSALGGFRGIIVDFLWLRAIRLERESRHFELVQLYDWIGKLEPHLLDIWVMNAHNLAYNISIAMPTREERWLWIQRGIDLLRSQGLRYNSSHPALYQEIGWLYLNKLGGRFDEYHWHYKTQHALQMQKILGWLIPDLEGIAQAPRKWQELLKKEPDVQDFAARAEALSIHLEQAHGELLWDEAGLNQEQLDFLRLEQNEALLRKVSAFFAAKSLREVCGLEPGRMLRLQEEYGPIDWRLPDATAFYWASIARELSEGDYEREGSNRVFYFAFVNLFRRGRLFLQEQGNDHLYITQPEIRFAERLHRHFEQIIPEAPKAVFAHEAFLEELVYTLFTYNQEAEARRWYKLLSEKYPKTQYQVSFDSYINEHIATDIRDANYEQTVVTLNGLIHQGYWWLAIGEEDRASGFDSLAKRVWTLYMESAAGTASSERLALPPLKTIRERVIKEAFEGPQALRFPPLLQERLKARLGI